MSRRFLILPVSVILVFGLTASYAYDPVGDNNRETEVKKAEPLPPEPVYPPYTGPKKRIAVTKFDSRVTGVYGSWNLGDGFAEMLTTELMKTGRFIVVERQALRDIVGEQELGQTGLVRRETAAKVGEMLGAQIIVRGVVSEFELRESGGGGGIGIAGFRLGVRSSSAHVAVDIRLIDTATGQVLHSHNAVGKAESSGVGIGVSHGQVDFAAEGFKKTPLGQATRQAIHDAVMFIINQMEAVPFTASVIKSEGNKVYINAGSLMNIRPGFKFFAYSVGEALIDPATGLNLGAEEKLTGTVEVRDVKDKYSIGILTSGGPLKRGDILKLQ